MFKDLIEEENIKKKHQKNTSAKLREGYFHGYVLVGHLSSK
jgi:hypothetical protein